MPPTLGVILAGGLARRMGGGDKPLLRLNGRTLLERVVERLAPQCAKGLVLSANGDQSRFAGFSGPILADTMPGYPGPLAGILAALNYAAFPTNLSDPEVPASAGLEGALQPASRNLAGFFEARLRLAPQDEGMGGRIDRVVSVSGDAPFLPLDLVARLHAALERDDTRIAVAASGERQHYTVALWPLALREAMREALEREQRGVGAFIARHGSVVVSWPTEPYDPFFNVNTPEDLAAAEALVARAEP